MSKSKCRGHLAVEEGELSRFIDSFRAKLDVNEATIIYNVLQQNKFQSRMQIKLITRDELSDV